MKRVIVSRPNKALIVPRDGRTIMFFPSAHRLTDLDTDSLVVPHDIHATVCLRQMGYKLPNPMLCYYDWRGGKPFAVQKATCDVMTTNPRSYVLNSKGTGKTKAALWAWDYLASVGCAGKMLVVATLSTLNFVWAAEAFATLPHRKVAVLHGTKKQRLAGLNSDADIFIINHDGLRTIEADLLLRTDIDTLVLDELAVYRNNSDRSKAMRKFAVRFKIVWGLTGGPMPQAPTDVWAQAKIITPNTVPKYFKQAEELLMNRRNTYQLIPKDNAIETAFRMLQPSVRYSLDAVVELPEVVYSTIDVPLTSQQSKVYKTLADAFVADVGAGRIVAVNSAVAMGKLLQVSGGWVYAGEAGAIALDSKPRQQMLIDQINENERKVIVMVPFTHALDGLSQVLTGPDPEHPYIEHCKVDGRVSQNDRSNYFNLFQNTDKYKVLLAHPVCLAHGLTLTAADTIIWYMPITSLDTYDQANGRITRIGQAHKQKIIHLQSTSVEKKIYRLLRSKELTQTAFLSMLASATGDAPT